MYFFFVKDCVCFFVYSFIIIFFERNVLYWLFVGGWEYGFKIKDFLFLELFMDKFWVVMYSLEEK